MCGHLWILHTTTPTSPCYGFSHKFPWVGTYTKSTPAYFQDDDGAYIYGIAGGPDGEELYDAIQEAIDSASVEADYLQSFQ